MSPLHPARLGALGEARTLPHTPPTLPANYLPRNPSDRCLMSTFWRRRKSMWSPKGMTCCGTARASSSTRTRSASASGTASSASWPTSGWAVRRTFPSPQWHAQLPRPPLPRTTAFPSTRGSEASPSPTHFGDSRVAPLTIRRPLQLPSAAKPLPRFPPCLPGAHCPPHPAQASWCASRSRTARRRRTTFCSPTAAA